MEKVVMKQEERNKRNKKMEKVVMKQKERNKRK